MLRIFYNRKISKAQKTLKKLGALKIKKKLDLKAIGVSHNKREILLNPNDEGLSAQLLAYGFREPINSYLLSQFIKKENFDVVIDVGSNIGYFPIVELESGAKKVIVIEPVPETFGFLHKNQGICRSSVSKARTRSRGARSNSRWSDGASGAWCRPLGGNTTSSILVSPARK